MAQQASVQYVDDLDGSAASGPVDFSLDGKGYTIDLSDTNAPSCARYSLPSSPRPAAPAGQLIGRLPPLHAQVAQVEAATRSKRCEAGCGRTAIPSKTAAASRPNSLLPTRPAHPRWLQPIVRPPESRAKWPQGQQRRV